MCSRKIMIDTGGHGLVPLVLHGVAHLEVVGHRIEVGERPVLDQLPRDGVNAVRGDDVVRDRLAHVFPIDQCGGRRVVVLTRNWTTAAAGGTVGDGIVAGDVRDAVNRELVPGRGGAIGRQRGNAAGHPGLRQPDVGIVSAPRGERGQLGDRALANRQILQFFGVESRGQGCRSLGKDRRGVFQQENAYGVSAWGRSQQSVDISMLEAYAYMHEDHGEA